MCISRSTTKAKKAKKATNASVNANETHQTTQNENRPFRSTDMWIVLNSPIQEVWEALMDTEEYHFWNTFIIYINKSEKKEWNDNELFEGSVLNITTDTYPRKYPFYHDSVIHRGVLLKRLDHNEYVMEWQFPHKHPSLLSSVWRFSLETQNEADPKRSRHCSHPTEKTFRPTKFRLEIRYYGFFRNWRSSGRLPINIRTFSHELKKHLQVIRERNYWDTPSACLPLPESSDCQTNYSTTPSSSASISSLSSLSFSSLSI